jgi:large subunit ribosomal protein L34
VATKRTYQPKKLKTLRKLGFRARSSSVGGKRVLKSRMKKGRWVLTKSDEFRKKLKKPNDKVR